MWAAAAVSSEACVLLEGHRVELGEAHVLAHQPAWCVDLDLADVGVAAVLVVGEDGDLDEVGAQRLGSRELWVFVRLRAP